MIGDRYILKQPLLGEKKGAIGVVVDEYADFEIVGELGTMIIFEDGNYDGFSSYDRSQFLDKLSHKPLDYKFENVITLSRDYEDGKFNNAFSL